jgi:hypothetical protein
MVFSVKELYNKRVLKKDHRKKLQHSLLFTTLIVAIMGMLVFLSNRQQSPQMSNPHPTAKPLTVKKVPTQTLPISLAPSETTVAASPSAGSGYCVTVPVLYYHHVQPLPIALLHGNTKLTVSDTIFATQMQYVASHGYTTITAEALVQAIRDHAQLPPKSLVITLDDGYHDNYTYAYPIFQKYHLTANIMLATGLVGKNDYLTWDEINEMHKSGFV